MAPSSTNCTNMEFCGDTTYEDAESIGIGGIEVQYIVIPVDQKGTEITIGEVSTPLPLEHTLEILIKLQQGVMSNIAKKETEAVGPTPITKPRKKKVS